jgi:hypothetical protein
VLVLLVAGGVWLWNNTLGGDDGRSSSPETPALTEVESPPVETPARVEIEPPLYVVDEAAWYTPEIKWYRDGDEVEVETPWYPDADVLERPLGDLSLVERICNATLYGYLDDPPETVTVYGTSHEYLESCNRS